MKMGFIQKPFQNENALRESDFVKGYLMLTSVLFVYVLTLISIALRPNSHILQFTRIKHPIQYFSIFT